MEDTQQPLLTQSEIIRGDSNGDKDSMKKDNTVSGSLNKTKTAIATSVTSKSTMGYGYQTKHTIASQSVS